MANLKAVGRTYLLGLNAPGPVQVTFPPFVHRIPTLDQRRAESLRRLAGLYLNYPGEQIGMVSTEAGTDGLYKW